jgi:hypothetical protein
MLPNTKIVVVAILDNPASEIYFEIWIHSGEL